MENSYIENGESENGKETKNINFMSNLSTIPYWCRIFYRYTIYFICLLFAVGCFLTFSPFDVIKFNVEVAIFRYSEILGMIGISIYCIFVAISIFAISRKRSNAWESFRVNLTMLSVFLFIYLVSLVPDIMSELANPFDLTLPGSGALFITPNIDHFGTLLQFI